MRVLRIVLPVVWVATAVMSPRPVSGQPYDLVASTIGGGATEGAGGGYTLRGTVGQSLAGPLSGGGYSGGAGFWYQVQGGGSLAIYANLKVFLEGPFDAGSMTASLNSGGHLASAAPSQPFGGAPWSYAGGESVAPGFFASNPTVVDWVLVELRTGDPTATMTVAARRAALLLSDGTVVDTDGSSLVAFDGLAAGSYYVVVHHRNHLAVMSGATISLGSTGGTAGAPYDHDFSSASTQAHGLEPMKALGGGTFGLYAGDADADGQVIATDYQTYWRVQNGGPQGYHTADFDLDGQVIATDYQILWRTNNSRESRVPPAN